MIGINLYDINMVKSKRKVRRIRRIRRTRRLKKLAEIYKNHYHYHGGVRL